MTAASLQGTSLMMSNGFNNNVRSERSHKLGEPRKISQAR